MAGLRAMHLCEFSAGHKFKSGFETTGSYACHSLHDGHGLQAHIMADMYLLSVQSLSLNSIK